MIRSTLAKIFMDVVAHTLLPEQVSDLREQFNKFDVSRTGSISVADLRAIMRQFNGFREEFLSVIVASLDLDQTGLIGYHEFLAATIRRQNVTEENLQIAFEIISNHGEFITSGDVAALLGGSSYKLDALMSEVGLSLDSKISYAEVSEHAWCCYFLSLALHIGHAFAVASYASLVGSFRFPNLVLFSFFF
jgi:Ca2+-binding EF-hand superfamily protein